MSETKLPYGKPVKLLIELQGFSDGRLVLFEIWIKKGGNEEKVTEVYGVTKGGKGVGKWIPLIERKEILLLKETIDEQVEEEKYYFIAKIDDQEVKSGDMVFTYPLDIYVEDEEGKAIDGAEYTVTFSDGSKKEGELKGGHAKFADAPPGKFKIELEYHEFLFGIIIKARWSKNKAKCGEEVKMIVDVEDFEDGTPAQFTIWEEDVDGTNDTIEQIEGEVQGDKVEAVWVYSPEEAEMDLQEDVEEVEGEPKYFFSVDIEGKKARSGILTLTYLLDICLNDEEGNRLDDVEYTIIFSDGTKRKGKSKDGHAIIEDAPFGKFTIEIEDGELIFE